MKQHPHPGAERKWSPPNGLGRLSLILLVIGCWYASSPLPAQPTAIDSLKALLRQPQPDTQRLDVLIDLGWQLLDQDPGATVTYSTQARRLATRVRDTTRLAKALNNLATYQYNLGKLDSAEIYWQEVLRLKEAQRDSLGIGQSYSNLGMLYETRGDLQAAVAAYRMALDLYERHGQPFYVAVVYNNIGLVYEKQGLYPRAIGEFLEALSIFEKEGQESAVAAVYNNLGMVYQKQKVYADAAGYYQRALAISRKNNNKNSIANNCNNLGGLYEARDLLDSALFYHQQALDLRRELGDQLGVCASYNNLGIAHYRLGNYARARDYQEQAYRLAGETGSRSDLARAGADLGRAYLQLGQVREAERYLQEALALSLQVGERENRLKVYRALYDLYKLRRDFRAFDFYEQYTALNDSLRNDEQVREITRLELNHQFDKEKELLALEHQRNEAVLSGQLQRQRLLRNASLGGLGGGLLVLGLLWQGYRQQQRSNHLLEIRKNKIQQALEERETLLREIHHRVKNNLQVVSSLLSLQSRTLDDPVALGALTEGRNRVRAMALIHQNLYQEESLVGVDLPHYIEKLTDSLVHSYHVDTTRIGIVRNVRPMLLDVDTLIPLGLILNELISNALKYAFPDREEGRIYIEIDEAAEGLEVLVRDDGVGLPADFRPETSNSLGYKLIRSFIEKMKARLEIFSEGGTGVRMILPRRAAAQ